MKQIYAFETKEEYEKFQKVIQSFDRKLKDYQNTLEKDYALVDLPKGVVWTTEELATTVFSELPIPAFTNKNLIYMSPDIHTWRKLLIKQLDGKDLPNIQNFYENFSENHLFVILAHELTHHSDLFMDEFDDERENSIWFEEGMCFYLPRKLLLNEKEFQEITEIETVLVEVFKEKYGHHSLEDFGESSYKGSLSSIMFDYWRSYLSVKHIVEVWANHNIKLVFNRYHQWIKDDRKTPLMNYFS
ncbi:hypothetical protein OEV98_03405 [Caldibacillus lycopersici]|uniref:Uncharacterized protein n=1 Tax=Perspicuibacillus lycopersici TaxID=1325689 RepID=A0AAE3LLQ3_9BACI|nr:hypothetical protein [Perspicuibacillus lycopersici]MCU9612610.1 hypothetical protein [Perspicuibacillus lycopersici]